MGSGDGLRSQFEELLSEERRQRQERAGTRGIVTGSVRIRGGETQENPYIRMKEELRAMSEDMLG